MGYPAPTMTETNILPVALVDALGERYLSYALSTIMARSLPDVRDGLKPVHRRLLYAMRELGLGAGRAPKKSARVVGDVIGKFHPHGDVAVYDTLVRLAQEFAQRYPLVDGQGNFGNVDGDSAAAMRYTEARLTVVVAALLDGIDQDTVDFRPTYDGSESEPVVLPAAFPNLLANGTTGIAVGMATSIPPHNAGELFQALAFMLERPFDAGPATTAELMQFVRGPDLPTGGVLIEAPEVIAEAYATGRGALRLRARWEVEKLSHGQYQIVVTEIPFHVQKARLIERLAELLQAKKLPLLADLRDESSEDIRLVLIPRSRGVPPELVMEQLFRQSELETRLALNMNVLDAQGVPRVMGLLDLLQAFIDHRMEVLIRGSRFRLGKIDDRLEILDGYLKIFLDIDTVIRIIREAPDPGTARVKLLERDWPASDMLPVIELVADRRTVIQEGGLIRLSDEQARAILDLRLHRLTGLGREEISNEVKALREKIEDYLDILRSRPRILDIIRSELREVREKFAVPRRSEFVEGDLDLEDEDLIEREDMVVTVTHGGYVKRTPLSTYRTQHRGGKGRSGMAMKDDDFITRVFTASTHTEVLFFSSAGMVYKHKVWRLPQGTPQSRGKAFVNLLPLDKDEWITSIMPLPEDADDIDRLDVMFATREGNVRRNRLSDFVNVNRNGKIAMKPDEGDGIVSVQICSPEDDVMLTTSKAACIRFRVSDVRVFSGRTSTGVKGIRLANGDHVISLTVLRHVDVTPEEARAYLKHAAALRRAQGDDVDEAAIEGTSPEEESEDEIMGETSLDGERLAFLQAAEQQILAITTDGMGKRAIGYDYRVTGRRGKGLIAHRISGNQRLAAAFRVEEADEVMLVTDAGQLIRTPVSQIRLAGRATQGVRVLRVAEGEKVVSVERVLDSADPDEESESDL